MTAMRAGAPWRRRLPSFVLAFVLAAGMILSLAACSTYSDSARRVRLDVVNGDVTSALGVLEEKGGDDPDVLNLLERGLLLHYEGRYAESNELFQLADTKIDDQYTKSVSGEVLAFLTNDGNLPYSGYPHEQVLMHLYGALNYLFMGDLSEALVECRRVGIRLGQLEQLREDKVGYTDDAFVEWLAGMLFAEDGDGNEAMVSARRAAAAYSEYDRLWSLGAPPDLRRDHLTWARRFGFADEAVELAAADSIMASTLTPMGRDEGQLVLVYECGFVDALEELALEFPILENDTDKDAELAPLLMRRGHRGVYVVPEKTKVKYWLRAAMPTMVPTTPELSRARLVVGDATSPSYLVEDVSAIASLTFEEGQGGRLLKTILRAIAKYKLTGGARKKGEFAGLVSNIFAAATERADTRSWTLLPDQIQMARLRLPSGIHEVMVEVLDSTGTVAQTATFQEVVIRPGETTIIRHRTFY